LRLLAQRSGGNGPIIQSFRVERAI
jgi:hypothetical protein